ncbi:MAG: hypothetical protein JJ863_06100 [Deltaproteobacteria bacterium]|nr:hypothetical protein [Deltaproteobacteria bacterium]
MVDRGDRLRAPLAGWVFLLLCSCTDPGLELSVDLKTDWQPGRQFVGVAVTLLRGDSTAPTGSEQVVATVGQDYLGGLRVAEFDGLTRGEYTLRVELLTLSGAVLAERDTLIELDGDFALTVILASSCDGLECPGEGDPAELQACYGGRCVDPRCSPERPELCGLSCAADIDCPSTVECSVGVCVDGACLQQLDDESCGPGFVCDLLEGCTLPAGADGGPPCEPSESSCTNGMDDDCDGNVDCADSECADMACDDESVCTEGDTCSGAVCVGTPIVCDDGNVCTDDSCDPFLGCVVTDNTAPCDDGSWCNGPDECRDGSCQEQGPPPCTEFCNEATMACDMCASNSDCGTTTRTDWGTCQYSNACDETGTQTRRVTRRTCDAGRCTSTTTTERRDCSRTVANGKRCGSGRMCCSGSCVSTSANRHCGACKVDCTNIGLTCRSTGNGGHACRGCSTNAACRSELNNSATCYDTSAPPAFCQCQCPSNGICANGGCGANFFCHDVPGTNFCSRTR